MKRLIRKIKRKAGKRSFSDPVENEKMMSALSYKSSGGKVMKKKTKGYQAGGKMPMVKKGGEMVPAFAADGVGKMMAGGKTGGMKISPKMMANGGATMVQRKNDGNTVARGSGAARPQRFGKNG